MKFITPNESLVLQTTKGVLEIAPNEYFIINDKDRKPLMINKEGAQKIEDFFGAQTEIVREGAALSSAYVVVRVTGNGVAVERLGSANNKNLSNRISQAYPLEMSFKRAWATAMLEMLRKNYTGTEKLPLLYSSFDEFQTDFSMNTNIPVEAQKSTSAAGNTARTKQQPPKAAPQTPPANKPETPPAEEKKDVTPPAQEEKQNEIPVNPPQEEKQPETPVNPPAQEEKLPVQEQTPPPAEEKPQNEASALGSYIIKSNKYRNGITLEQLAEKDMGYLNWLVTNETAKGRYLEYQQKAREYVQAAGITLPA